MRDFVDGPTGIVPKVVCDKCDRVAKLRPSGLLPKGWCRIMSRGVHWGDKCPACRKNHEEER